VRANKNDRPVKVARSKNLIVIIITLELFVFVNVRKASEQTTE
jgi:hypothetical protein